MEIIFDSYIIVSYPNNVCSVWSIDDRWQKNPFLVFDFQGDTVLSHIYPREKNVHFLFSDKNGLFSHTMTWNVSCVKLNSKHTKFILKENLLLPKGKGIIQDWVEYSHTKTPNKFIDKIQKLVASQYPWLHNVSNSFVITDNSLPDNPIIYVNSQFLKTTQYEFEDIIGSNCRFLQGKYTDPDTVREISLALRIGKSMSAKLLNYKKDGTPFWNMFSIFPVRNKNGKILAFIALQKDEKLIELNEDKFHQWGKTEVSLWLESKGMEEYAQIFFSQGINGAEFLGLEEGDYICLGISTSDAKKIRKLVYPIKANIVSSIYSEYSSSSS
eukprot:TRINITY_DN7614_c0_g1_i2.p1 TRINITY_DN7614_c0_g1~~TRINITY_DN7614_c0_g1_i2.p1  ORF type:complete len:327 (-),score=45.35 TRINITY_DN7614_c0_g1_i2:139-1119(-)